MNPYKVLFYLNSRESGNKLYVKGGTDETVEFGKDSQLVHGRQWIIVPIFRLMKVSDV